MTGTDELIASLSKTATPVKPAAPPLAFFMKWLVGIIAYIALLLMLYGVRDDLAAKFDSPLFVGEICLLVVIILTAGMSAVTLSFPDLHQKKWLAWLPAGPLALFIALLAMAYQVQPPVPLPPHGMECLLCIAMFSALPAAAIMSMLRKLASTHYLVAGGVALIASSAVGCLALRLSEKTDSIMHVVEWHYLPMIGFAAIGVVLGGRFLKW